MNETLANERRECLLRVILPLVVLAIGAPIWIRRFRINEPAA